MICSLRARLSRTVKTGLRRSVAQDDDGADQAAALVIADDRAKPVTPRPVKLQRGGAARVVGQPQKLAVAVTWQQRAMRVLIIIDELELQLTTARHHDDRRLPHQLIQRNP